MAGKPRILFLIGSLREGGAEGQLVHLMEGLKDRGYIVAVMLLRREGARLAQVEAAGFPVFDAAIPKFRPRWNPMPWLQLFRSWKSSRATVKSWHPHIVHSWLFWSHVWSWLILPPGEVPVLITGRRQTWSDSNRSPILQWLQRRINCRTQLVISNSKRVEESVCQREANLPRHVVAYNGIDLSRFTGPAKNLQKEFGLPENHGKVLITVANLLPHKGYDVLLAAWRQVQRRHRDAVLICVGSDGGIQAALERKLEAWGIRDSVVFAGLRNDVPELLLSADLAIHASRDEGFSNAIVEYMAAGLPVVATDVGGTAEALSDTGIVVAPGDPKALAQGVHGLLKIEKRAKRLGQEAKARVEREFPLDKMVEDYVALIRPYS